MQRQAKKRSGDAGLQFRRQFLELGHGEHRAVHADIVAADVAAATDADTALHALFQRGHDVLGLEAQFFQGLQGELDHDRRTAEHGHAVVRAGVQLGQHVGDQTHLVRPAFVGIVDAERAIQVGVGQPALQLVAEGHVARRTGAVQQAHLA